MRYMDFVTSSCSLLGPTLWKLNGLVLSLVTNFFDGLPTWAGICFTINKHLFRYDVNMFLLMWEFRGRHLVISSSYHTCILFIFSPFPHNTMYSSWFATSYNRLSFMVLVWSYHWWSRYPFVSMPLQKWTYNNLRYNSKYCRNYYFKKWNTCLEGNVPPFPLPHLMMSGYP